MPTISLCSFTITCWIRKQVLQSVGNVQCCCSSLPIPTTYLIVTNRKSTRSIRYCLQDSSRIRTETHRKRGFPSRTHLSAFDRYLGDEYYPGRRETEFLRRSWGLDYCGGASTSSVATSDRTSQWTVDIGIRIVRKSGHEPPGIRHQTPPESRVQSPVTRYRHEAKYHPRAGSSTPRCSSTPRSTQLMSALSTLSESDRHQFGRHSNPQEFVCKPPNRRGSLTGVSAYGVHPGSISS